MAGIRINPATGYAGFSPKSYGIEGYGISQASEAVSQMGAAAKAEADRQALNRQIVAANRAANVQLGSSLGTVGGSYFGAKVGSIGGPVGAIVGSVIGGLLGGLF